MGKAFLAYEAWATKLRTPKRGLKSNWAQKKYMNSS